MKIYRNRKYEQKITETYRDLLAQWKTDLRELDVPGQYGTTHVIEFGQKDRPPLVLFHGVGDDAALMWIYNAEAWAQCFHVFAVDTIGGPGLSRPDNGYNRDFDDILWIDGLLEHLGLEKVFMAGVSNGGYLTQAYAINRPDRVIRGISMAGTVPVSTGKSSMSAMMKIFLPEALFPTDRNVVKLIRKMTGTNYRAFCDNPKVFEHFKLLMTGFNRAAMLNHRIRSYDAAAMDSIRSRMLYIAGERDPFMKLGGGELLKSFNMNTIWLKDAGHGINHEMASEVNQAVISWFCSE